MYDCIVVESPLLPNGVNLPEVLEGADESEVKEILASMPEPGQRISAAALVAAGVHHLCHRIFLHSSQHGALLYALTCVADAVVFLGYIEKCAGAHVECGLLACMSIIKSPMKVLEKALMPVFVRFEFTIL